MQAAGTLTLWINLQIAIRAFKDTSAVPTIPKFSHKYFASQLTFHKY